MGCMIVAVHRSRDVPCSARRRRNREPRTDWDGGRGCQQEGISLARRCLLALPGLALLGHIQGPSRAHDPAGLGPPRGATARIYRRAGSADWRASTSWTTGSIVTTSPARGLAWAATTRCSERPAQRWTTTAAPYSAPCRRISSPRGWPRAARAGRSRRSRPAWPGSARPRNPRATGPTIGKADPAARRRLLEGAGRQPRAEPSGDQGRRARPHRFRAAAGFRWVKDPARGGGGHRDLYLQPRPALWPVLPGGAARRLCRGPVPRLRDDDADA